MGAHTRPGVRARPGATLLSSHPCSARCQPCRGDPASSPVKWGRQCSPRGEGGGGEKRPGPSTDTHIRQAGTRVAFAGVGWRRRRRKVLAAPFYSAHLVAVRVGVSGSGPAAGRLAPHRCPCSVSGAPLGCSEGEEGGSQVESSSCSRDVPITCHLGGRAR